ncbi:FAD-dependent oxidoreductase [Saccharopolyspora sp. NPDC050389]|uniref:FAD-dependent oxidoreductase n=1 Tax=Saccharopolyspora sp. NPDC050389 TaxID=3155516 RepID=UPI0033C39A8B
MMKPRIAVVGTGTIGAQALWQLSKLDCEVTGYELFNPGHPRGAAGGESRLFRHIEMEDLRYLPIVERADQLWQELEAETGEQLRNIGGALVFGAESSPAMRIALQAADLLGDRVRVMTREEVRREYPQYNIDDDELAILDLRAGTIFPERAIRTAASAAGENGATLRPHTRVTDIQQRGNRVLVTADGRTEEYDRVLVAAGAWTATLLPDMAPYLATRRLLSTWFLPRTGESVEGMLPFVRTEPNYSYGLPTADGLAMKLGLGFAHHAPIESPDTADQHVSEEDLAAVRELTRKFLPGFEDYPMRMNTYFEAYTHSRVEYVQSHPNMNNVIVMAGFSGKGFKNCPAIGEIGARLALALPQRDEAAFLTAFTPVEQV